MSVVSSCIQRGTAAHLGFQIRAVELAAVHVRRGLVGLRGEVELDGRFALVQPRCG